MEAQVNHSNTDSSNDEWPIDLIGRHDPFLRPVDTAAALKFFVWHEFELARMTMGWVPAVQSFELKAQLSRHGYVHMMNVKHLQERIKELSGGLNEREGTPKKIRTAYERIAMSADETSFLIGYQFVLQHLYADYDAFSSKLDSLLDAPTVDQLKKIFVERNDLLNYIQTTLHSAYGRIDKHEEDSIAVYHWKQYIKTIWTQESGNWPEHPVSNPAGPVPTNSVNDPRFVEAAPKHTKAGSHLYNDVECSPLFNSVKQMVFINATEIIAAESLAYLFYSVHHMPLEFYCDLARHLWDEVRHSQMGVRRLQQLGYSLEQFKFFPHIQVKSDSILENFIEGYFSLTNVAEACSFTVKRKAVESFWKFNDPLSAIQSEFDIVDERMHVEFGTKWGPELYKSLYEKPITAKNLAEKAREHRLKQYQFDSEEAEKIAKSVTQFCGIATVRLEYNHY